MQANPNRWREALLFLADSSCPPVQAPGPEVLRQPVALNVASVIEDDGVVLAFCWPEASAGLLQEQAQALRGSEHDATSDARNVRAFADDFAAAQNLDVSRRKAPDHALPLGSLKRAIYHLGAHTGGFELIPDALGMFDRDAERDRRCWEQVLAIVLNHVAH